MQYIGKAWNYAPEKWRGANTNSEKNKEFMHMSAVLINNFDYKLSKILNLNDGRFSIRDIIAERVINNIENEFHELATQLMNSTLTYSEYKSLNKTTLVPYVEDNYKNKLQAILLRIIQKYGIADLYDFNNSFDDVIPFTNLERNIRIVEEVIAQKKARGARNNELKPSIEELSRLQADSRRPPPVLSRRRTGSRGGATKPKKQENFANKNNYE